MLNNMLIIEPAITKCSIQVSTQRQAGEIVFTWRVHRRRFIRYRMVTHKKKWPIVQLVTFSVLCFVWKRTHSDVMNGDEDTKVCPEASAPEVILLVGVQFDPLSSFLFLISSR